jgi:aromatic-L-amino-acid decarboxylase
MSLPDLPPRSDTGIGDLDPEEMRRHGHAVVDWIADYLAGVESRRVLPDVAPGELIARLPSSPPAQPEALGDILADVDALVMPGITHWQSPGFLAYFSSTASVPGILGEMLAAALSVNAMLWRTSPAATELEQVAVDWLRQMLGLPAPLFGCINDTASSSTLYALAAARESIPGGRIRKEGLSGLPRLRYYASEEAHSSVEKAGIVLGTGTEGLRRIAVDDAMRMGAAALQAAISEDRAAGWLPFAVVATAGTTSTASVDPVADIATICEREGLWLHVDAAYGGAAATVPELRSVLDGCERADSLVVNPHKWLFTPMDCSVLYTRHQAALRNAFSLVPEYLTSATGGEPAVTNLMDYGTSLGRRFRALKLWMVLRTFGTEGIAARIREHVRIAQQLASSVESTPGWELLAPASLSVVCMRAHPDGVDDEAALDELNARIIDDVNARGHFFISHTRVRGHYSIRVAVNGVRTEERHVRALWDELRDAAGGAAGSTGPTG